MFSHEGADDAKSHDQSRDFVLLLHFLLLEAVVAAAHDGESSGHFEAADQAVEEPAVAIGDGELGVQSIMGQEVEGVNQTEDSAVEGAGYDVAAEVSGRVLYGVYLVADGVGVHIKLIWGWIIEKGLGLDI